MPVLVIVLFFGLLLVLYGRFRNGIWATRELFLTIFGERNQGKIIDVYVKDRNIRENYVYQKTYIMAIEYLKNDRSYRTKVIVTDSENKAFKYSKGNTLFIITSKTNNGISILDYSKYKPKKNHQENQRLEKNIDAIVKEGKES